MSDFDTSLLVREAGEFGKAAIEQYRTASPEGFAALSKLFEAGEARFDLAVRDVTGLAPMVELVVAVGDTEQVIASQVLKRRLPS